MVVHANGFRSDDSGSGWEADLLVKVLSLPEDAGKALLELLRHGAELTGADALLFQRIRYGLVITEASLGTAEDLEKVDFAQGYLCSHVISRAGPEPMLLGRRELAPFARTDPWLRSGAYSFCLAQVVEGTDGVLILLYREEFSPGSRDREAIRLLASAVGREWKRKRLREKVQELEDKFVAFLNTAPEGFLIADESGKIAFFNRGASRIFGRPSEEVLGQSVLTLVPEEKRKSCRRQLLEGKETGEIGLVGKVFEAEGRRVDGTAFPMEVSVASWQTERGKHYGIVIRDITWRKSVEEDLRRSIRELEEFAHTVAHDLRNPLTLMGGYAQTALNSMEEGDMDTLRACLEGIERAARRGLGYLDSLLSFAKAERSIPSLRPVDPRSVFSGVMEELGARIRSTGAIVRVNEPLPLVVADPVHLHQVLANLLDNALKHGKPDAGAPEVAVGAEIVGDEAVFYVRDNGPGVPDEIRDKIFLPFHRFSQSGEPGLGIGLSTAKRLVELAGGRIWVDPNPTGGAVFRFTLPLAPSGLPGPSTTVYHPRRKAL
ncbi:MAG: PAS domain-containing sensor histidine kinase [Candidatus Geothermincolales bacterium]